MTFNCAGCLEEDLPGPGATLAGLQLCTPCRDRAVITTFDDALKWERHYPPTFAGVVLDPQDYITLLPDPHEFLQKWAQKKNEYATPPKERLHCAKCRIFLCPYPQASCNIKCFECSGLTCFPCGADLTVQRGPHVCPPPKETTDESCIEGQVRGRDYQLCPDCNAPIYLEDGCNHMTCEASAACGAQFCFVCGEKATASSGHWNVGRSCPRYNQPGEPNAQFDDEDDFAAPPPLSPGINAMVSLHETINSALQSFPSVAHLSNRTPQEQRQAEEEMHFQLLGSDLGRFMWSQQSRLDDMLNQLDDTIRSLRTQGLAVEAWMVGMRGFLLDLRTNLEIYVFRIRTVQEYDEFHQRDAKLFAEVEVNQHYGIWTRVFPSLRNTYAAYQAFADAYLTDFSPHVSPFRMGDSGAIDYQAAEDRLRMRMGQRLAELQERRSRTPPSRRVGV